MPETLNVTLIGATGFIGRRIAASLIEAGHEVVGTVRPDSRRRDGLPLRMEIKACSLQSDDEGLCGALGSADAVIYAAGEVRGISIDDFRPANVDGVAAVADILAKRSDLPPPLLLISSLAATEPQLSNYARSKREGEAVLREHPDLACSIIRPPAVYGPGDREMRRMFDWIRRGFVPRTGPRGQRLSLLHSDDLAQAVVAWLRCDRACLPRVLSLHDGREGGYSFDEIVDEVAPGKNVWRIPLPRFLLTLVAWMNERTARIFGGKPMLSLGKVRELRHPTWVCDNAAITGALGWRPETSLREGIEELYR